jgi:hypothetical protein
MVILAAASERPVLATKELECRQDSVIPSAGLVRHIHEH